MMINKINIINKINKINKTSRINKMNKVYNMKFGIKMINNKKNKKLT